MGPSKMTTWAILATATSVAMAAPFVTYQAECNKTALLAATDAYVAAQTAGKLDSLQTALAGTWKYMENNKEIEASKGVLRKALKIDHRRTITDLLQCASYSEIVSASDPANPYVIGTQVWLDSDSKVKLIDTIASTTGSWLFDAKKTLDYVQKETWTPIPEDKWDSREKIQAAGDAYLDMWSNATAHETIPWGTPCVRLEGSAYTGKGQRDDSCKPGIPSNHNQAPNTMRRYVIDQSMGSVSIFCLWQHMMNAADSHEFRLENGKLRYVHTMTECGGKTCKL